MMFTKTILATTFALMAMAAHADITIGVVQPLTGPASGLGIPVKNAIAIWPKTIAGENLKVIVLDDATDPTAAPHLRRQGRRDRRLDRHARDDSDGRHHRRIGHAAAVDRTGRPAAGQGQVAVPPAAVERRHGLRDGRAHEEAEREAAKSGIKVVGTERFARADTSVTAQALKLTSANPDAILIVASGSGAGMPQKAIMERGYKGKVYQTHAAATQDLMRTAGKDADGTFVVSGPAVIAEQLPDSHPSKKMAIAFVQNYEKAYGPGSRNQFAGHGSDALTVLEKAVPIAMKKAKPGTPEFRAALRDAFETMGRTVLAHGVLDWTAADHWGYTNETGVMLKVVDGKFKVEQ